MDFLVDALATKGFASLDTLEVPEATTFDSSRFRFVGWRPYWGSMVTVALHQADRIDSQGGSAILDELYSFTNSLRKYAGSVNGVRLGSFGILLHAFKAGCAADLRAALVSQKRGGALRHNYCLSWVLDLQEREAYRHRGLPLTMYPGHRWVGEVLRRGEVAV